MPTRREKMEMLLTRPPATNPETRRSNAVSATDTHSNTSNTPYPTVTIPLHKSGYDSQKTETPTNSASTPIGRAR